MPFKSRYVVEFSGIVSELIEIKDFPNWTFQMWISGGSCLSERIGRFQMIKVSTLFVIT